ncbi:hypothetical protein [Natranaerobius thermophilus]|uniref:Lipopolysaccharide biosynthesis protein n=1 Tax=Natranaerobius thermophilus (strain ATCC BAA-1301 / DSM 18059 / JW/NM-WN-LF) TaxID=457570 RepID=B2A1C5_NATTJ|nr:hypothetical protein [Natranaerobius thermophilus]ACB86063.1 lipopolysaccharide biosynthesis protein [Natranaerobius thermophilus JW/NM-WN-LF]
MLVFRQLKLIIAIIIVFLLLGLGYHFHSLGDSYSSVTANLMFENIHQGEYPDGSSFDKNDFLSDEVLEGALEETGLDDQLSRRELFLHLEVEGYIPEELRGRTSDAVDEFHPNEYRINIIDGEALDLSQEEQYQLLQAIVDQFEQAHGIELGMEHPLSDSFKSDVEEVLRDDYPFVPMVLEHQVNMLADNVEVYEMRNPSFQSQEHGYTFSDMAYHLEDLKETKIGEIRAIIKEHNLTTDPDVTLRRYQNLVEDLEVEIAEYEERSDYARDLLSQIEDGEFDLEEEYDIEEGEDSENIIQDLLRQDYIPELLERSLDAGVEAQALNVDLEYYRDIMEGIEAGDIAEGEEAEQAMQEVNEEIDGVLSDLDYYVQAVEDMRRELLAGEDTVQITQGPRERGVRSIIINLGLFGVMGAFAGLGAAIVKEYRRDISRVVSNQKDAFMDTGEKDNDKTG